MVAPPGVVEPPPGAGAGAGEDGAGAVVAGAGVLPAGAAVSSFLLQALSATASTDAMTKVLLIIFGTPLDDDS
ncbi:hypothetical protein AD428_17475 [Achromobacter sp. DMS1]|nr:hypothetical protein AD428_17475 [Achromobacter sp. DMS1]